MLMLLEGKAGAYIQDRGVSRWDTCGAQACIEAYGGVLCKLSSFMAASPEQVKAGTPESIIGYTYLGSAENLDFIPDLASLTLYNCSQASGLKKGHPSRLAAAITDVKPYSNLCGLLALGAAHNTPQGLQRIHMALLAAAEKNLPAYD